MQGVVLGNVGTYVDASVDPETLTHSKAALAQALCRQGLVQEAMRGGGDGLPLLRGITAQTLAGVAGEEQVIVFAERVWCLRQLARTLTERYGVEAHVGDGQVKGHEFEQLKRRFTAGEFPVLCLSQIGHEGHNLQIGFGPDAPRSTLGPDGTRAARRPRRPPWRREELGADLHPLHPRRRGRAHRLDPLPRGAEHHQILDSFEGVRASESTIATQLGAIADQVADSKNAAGYAATAARLKVAASVFGA